MKDIVFNVPEELNERYDEVEIHTFADLHIGDKMCDMQSITNRIEHVKNTPNAFAILNGDLCNTGVCTSNPFDESMTPMKQIEMVVNLFKPLADMNKIISVVGGNHEARTYRLSAVDITKLFCAELGIADRFSTDGCLVFLTTGKESRGRVRNGKVRDISYTIYHQHGSGGGGQASSKVGKLVKLSAICDADIYIMAHTHLPSVIKEDFIRTDPRNHCHRQVTKLMINTGSSIGGSYGGYGEVFGFKPSTNDTPILKLGMHKKYYKAVL